MPGPCPRRVIAAFSLYWGGAHRGLHSFPARPSSDLFDRLGLRRGDRVLDMGCGAGRHAFEMYRRGGDVIAFDRSEEHTSELQSQFHLVCRLLLEKKNT